MALNSSNENLIQQFIDDAIFLSNYLKVENLSNHDYDAKLTVKIGKRIEKMLLILFRMMELNNF